MCEPIHQLNQADKENAHVSESPTIRLVSGRRWRCVRLVKLRTVALLVCLLTFSGCDDSKPPLPPNQQGSTTTPSMDKNNYLIKLSESEHTAYGRVAFAQQPEPQKVFSAIWALESQVNNGGFLQYFVSSDYDTANFAPTALRSIGTKACASIVERALVNLSPTPLPDSREACERLVKSLSSAAPQTVRETRLRLHGIPRQPHGFALCIRRIPSRGFRPNPEMIATPEQFSSTKTIPSQSRGRLVC